MFERGIRQALTLFPSPSSPLSWLSIGFSLFSLPPLPPSVGSLSGSHSFPSPSSPFSWLSIGFLSFAQLGLYHPGSQEQEGWAWAGFGDAVEAMGLDTFVRVSGVGLDTFVRVSGGNGARHFCAGEWVSVWDGFTAGEHTHTVHTSPPPQGALCNSREEDLRQQQLDSSDEEGAGAPPRYIHTVHTSLPQGALRNSREEDLRQQQLDSSDEEGAGALLPPEGVDPQDDVVTSWLRQRPEVEGLMEAVGFGAKEVG